ncbi:hypothetical protein K491DRAFT_695991 [Lophiostoma macrostomum CBS 122681]|uniref:DUF1772-domain-containing protein n=1 Tax=Lophiostoma macrostomum CBS 122681 TaxID=1314788 RepID=A0A6A6SZG8_9PLEO|nr:hypothetical protein K491DRAFT_695991 [Lophiostoma macrostomum CBS 122681]
MSFLSEKPPTSLLVAQAVGITASAYLFGNNACISYGSVPAILMAPAPLAVKQWAKVYDTGHKVGPALAVISALATAYVAYHQDPTSLPFKLNAAATVLVPSIIPFTFAFIVSTNKKLFAKEQSLAATALEDKAAEAGVSREETVHALIDKWATLNLARALLVGAGSVAAAAAVVLVQRG